MASFQIWERSSKGSCEKSVNNSHDEYAELGFSRHSGRSSGMNPMLWPFGSAWRGGV